MLYSEMFIIVRGMDVENDAAGIKERTKKCWYYLEDIHLKDNIYAW